MKVEVLKPGYLDGPPGREFEATCRKCTAKLKFTEKSWDDSHGFWTSCPCCNGTVWATKMKSSKTPGFFDRFRKNKKEGLPIPHNGGEL